MVGAGSGGRVARLSALALAVALAGASLALGAQTKKPVKRAAPKPAPPPPPVSAPADMTCPQVLGAGLATKRQFCDVVTGRDPAGGILIRFPPHKGPVTLTFDLHNRHTFSEQLVKAGSAYAGYTATIGVLTMEGTLIRRGVVRSEFRTAKDLFDRVGGGAGPRGVKAVAPTGVEAVTIEIPEGVDAVSILGEKLSVLEPNGSQMFTAPGRPIALVSQVRVEYQPLPKPAAKKPPAKKPSAKKPPVRTPPAPSLAPAASRSGSAPARAAGVAP